jgi:Bacterial TniB protein
MGNKKKPAKDKAHRNKTIKSREELWMPEEFRDDLIDELHALTTDPLRHRTRSIAIIAEANGGKSSIAKRYLKLHPPVVDAEITIIPAIFLNMNKIAQVEDLSHRLLEQVCAPKIKDENHTDRMDRFVKVARQVGLKLIFLDEFQDCANTKSKDKIKGEPFLRCIKGLLLDNLHVVPMGTESLAAVLSSDPQLTTRFNFSRGRLPRIDDLKVIKALMLEMSELSNKDISDAAVNYVFNETKGVLGHILDLTEDTFVAYKDLKLPSLRETRKLMDVLDFVA